MFNPTVQYTVHTIRRVTRSSVWYLHSHELQNNKCVWTSEYHKAHRFEKQKDATDFIKLYLGERSEECDVFSQESLWMGGL